jgi:hypothetical protein
MLIAIILIIVWFMGSAAIIWYVIDFGAWLQNKEINIFIEYLLKIISILLMTFIMVITGIYIINIFIKGVL